MQGVRRVFKLSQLLRHDVRAEVDEEIAFHLAMREARLRRSGIPAGDAHRIAVQRFGDVANIRDDCLRERDQLQRRRNAMMLFEEIGRDIVFALRSLRRAKGFTTAVVLSLALGIGANALVFSLMNRVVLEPVTGVASSAELFELSDVFSYPLYRDLQENDAGIRLAAISPRSVALSYGAATEMARGGVVSGTFFTVLGARAEIGRLISESDDGAEAPPVAVISHEYWVRALGSDPSVINSTILVNGAPLTVIGVVAKEFRGLQVGNATSVFVPISTWPTVRPSTHTTPMTSRDWGWLRLVGRLAPGQTFEQAHSILSTRVTAAEPGTARETAVTVTTPRPIQNAAIAGDARDGVVTFITILAAVVAMALLATCFNIAGLMISRATTREREIAVRVSLGAGRARLLTQLLVEALVLAVMATSVGLGLFILGRAALQTIVLPGGITGASVDLSIDARLVAFAVAITLTITVLFGLIPAIQASRADAISALKGAGRTRGSRQQWVRSGLAAAQIAVALVLVFATGLFTRALDRALESNLGFNPDGIASITVQPGLARLSPDAALAYYTSVKERVSALPGVETATWANAVPLTSDQDRSSATFDGYQPAPDERVRVEFTFVGAGFHDVMQIPLIAGRTFNDTDTPTTQSVVVVNETLVDRYFAGANPVGRFMALGEERVQIIGVARDAKYHAINEEPRPLVYLSFEQSVVTVGGFGSPSMFVRTTGDPAAMLGQIEAATKDVNNAVPVYDAMTMASRLNYALAPQLAGAWVLGIFSTLALVVAAVGIYGIISNAVNYRTREIGIRIALGARAGSVVRLVVAGNLVPALVGVPVGVALALVLSKGLTRFLYGVPANDPVTVLSAVTIMVGVSVLAAALPAARATRTDPLITLKSDA